jgi:hypothetical protein
MMSNAARQESARRRPHAPPMAGPFLEFDLAAEIDHQLVRDLLTVLRPLREEASLTSTANLLT